MSSKTTKFEGLLEAVPDALVGVDHAGVIRDIPCVIEGVETEAQLAAIQGMAVLAQGWIWGKPQGPESIPMLNPLSLPRDDPDTTETALRS